MSAKTDRILDELYRIDPSLRDAASGGGEATLRKIIEDLIESKPEAKLDDAFAAELKQRLLAEFERRPKPVRRRALVFLARPAFRVAFGTAVAASVLFAVYFGLGPRPGSPIGTEVAVVSSVDGATRQAAPTAPAAQKTGQLSPAKPATAPRQKAPAAAPQISASSAAGPGGKDGLALAPASDRAAETELPSRAAVARLQSEESELDRRAESQAPQARGAPSPVAPSLAGKKADRDDAAADVLSGRFNQDFNTEGYDRIVESSFAKVLEEPLSTFSIDVDTASYANVRRFLRGGSLPPPDAVRIEELVNYFPYDYAGPSGGEGPGEAGSSGGDAPFAFDTELSPCPWNAAHSLLRVALQARRISDKELPPSNLVFLIDVSGSMEDENKLPLVKEALKLLARRMRQQDRISIVVYAGNAGLVLEPTPGSRKDTILKAIDDLESGGSTAGGEGILLAYETAKKAFIPKGLNRVILATDGDFNVGASSDGELVRIIENERKAGVFLTVLGFGMGNYKDSKMQKLADSGNGNYAYVDTLAEADKVLGRQMAGTLFTVAKDVKVQIEFNPARVGEYRLIGYEKRALAARDFADDAKDAGELGAGSSVTALYELTPPAGASARTDLKYQSAKVTSEGASARELMTLKFRYKKPDGSASSLVEEPVAIEAQELARTGADFRFAAAVAEWGLILRESAYKGSATLEQVASLARGARGRDAGGYRAEFLELVTLSQRLGR